MGLRMVPSLMTLLPALSTAIRVITTTSSATASMLT